VDAIVDEWPILSWEARHRYPGRVAVAPQPFARGFISFALPRDSPRRRPLDVTLLDVLEDPCWGRITRPYLGASGEASDSLGVPVP
jgi:hypothetical protein